MTDREKYLWDIADKEPLYCFKEGGKKYGLPCPTRGFRGSGGLCQYADISNKKILKL